MFFFFFFFFLPCSLFLPPTSPLPLPPYLLPSLSLSVTLLSTYLPFVTFSLSFSLSLDSSPLPIIMRVTEITRLVTQMLKNDWSLASHLQPITSQYFFIIQKYAGIIVLIVGCHSLSMYLFSASCRDIRTVHIALRWFAFLN